MKWTKAEIEEFDDPVDAAGSMLQMDRIRSRLEMPAFIEKHGKPKCDAMFAHLESGGDKDDFSDEAVS